MRILITGERGVGKSTVTEQVFEKLAIRPIGLRSFSLYENHRKIGFVLQDLQTGEKRLFAHRDFPNGERFADFRVNKRVFEEFGVPILKAALLQSGWILVDEVGLMEMDSEFFVEALKDLWKSSANQFWVVQKRSPFLRTLAESQFPHTLFEVSLSNRDNLAKKIVERIKRGETDLLF